LINKHNLLLLAAALEKLPASYSHFDMMDFVLDADGIPVAANTPSDITKKLIHSCGTCACAIGHAPTIRGLRARKGESWGKYSTRVFGFNRSDPEFNFCFGATWAYREGDEHATADAAAKRLHYLAEHGMPEKPYWTGYLDA
jgi:hypothetical protein